MNLEAQALKEVRSILDISRYSLAHSACALYNLEA